MSSSPDSRKHLTLKEFGFILLGMVVSLGIGAAFVVTQDEFNGGSFVEEIFAAFPEAQELAFAP